MGGCVTVGLKCSRRAIGPRVAELRMAGASAGHYSFEHHRCAACAPVSRSESSAFLPPQGVTLNSRPVRPQEGFGDDRSNSNLW